MTRLLKILAAGVLIALAVCFGAVTLLVLHIDQRLNGPTGVLMRLEGVESKANATLSNLDTAAANLNKAAATWAAASQAQAAEVTKLARHLDTTLTQADGAVGAAATTLSAIGDQARGVGPLLASAQRATDAVTPLLHETQATIADARAPMDAGAKAFGDFDALLRNPDLAASLRNTSSVTSSAALAGGDVQRKLHVLLYPPPCSGKWCWTGKALNGIRVLGPLAEPAYYLKSLMFPN